MAMSAPFSANRSWAEADLTSVGLNAHSLESIGKVAVDGGEIEYRLYRPHDDGAASQTPLVVTHGGPGGSSIGLYDALHALADLRPVVFYDQLGSHASPAQLSAEQMTLQRFADEPLHLLDALDIPSAALLGHSWGGSVITQFCINHPSRVNALVLSSPLLSTRRWVDDCTELLNALRGEGVAEHDLEASFNQRHFCRRLPPPPALLRERSRSNTSLYEAMWGPNEFAPNGRLNDLDLFPQLHTIAAPTLLLCGQYDTATPTCLDEARKAIGAHASTVVLGNAGHKCYLDQHQAYMDAVIAFLGSHLR